MPPRYLFGPVSATHAAERLHEQRQAGACLAFNAVGDVDLLVTATDDWPAVLARLPAGWQPDFIVLNLGYTCVPGFCWSQPLPLVGLAQDWNLLWHYYRRRLRQCELVLTDTLGVETLHREGIAHARAANLFGCDRSWVERPWPETVRDIDVLFVGNFNPAVQGDRLPWFARLARLAPRRRVVLSTGVFGDDYRRLLARARIVFNFSIRGECNLRVLEAAAAGALLFQEAGNREVSTYFRDGAECVLYDAGNLEALLDYYLDHEDKRRGIAEAARARIGELTFARLWQQQVEQIEAELPDLRERARSRFVPDAVEGLRTRTWEVLCASLGNDPGLEGDLRSTIAREARAELYHALGMVAGMPATAAARMEAARAFGAALTGGAGFQSCQNKVAGLESCPTEDAGSESCPTLSALNAAEAFADLGQVPQAVEQARQALHSLEQGADLSWDSLDAAHYPPRFDVFRVEWERAAWDNAGRPEAEVAAKRLILQWRLHGILAKWTGAIAHYRAAVQARPDLWPSLAALGCALGRAGLAAEAIGFLRQAVDANPLDPAAARALGQALADAGDRAGLERLVQDRRLLATAVPVLPREAWFENSDVGRIGNPSSSDVGRICNPSSSMPDRLEYRQLSPERDGLQIRPTEKSWLQTRTLDEFHHRFGTPDTSAALCGFTNAVDTRTVLTLLVHARPRRILEIGTAEGHMTANFTHFSDEEAVVFTLGTVVDLPANTAQPQRYETPDRQHFGRLANAFGKAAKVFFITADSLDYDFRRLDALDFAFIDGAHDFRHVLSDTLSVYDVLRPGGWIVWHDFTSPVNWVEVRGALERIRLDEPVVHVAGTAVAFLRKQDAPGTAGRGAASISGLVGKAASFASQSTAKLAASPTGLGSFATPATNPPYVEKPDNGTLSIVWEGTQQAIHSLAIVNRQLCAGLLARGHDVCVLASGYAGMAERAPNGSPPPPGFQVVDVAPVPMSPALAGSFYRSLPRPAEIHVRHQWPPQLTPPAEGRWVFMQPWEYGSIPKAWVAPLMREVDEIWANTRYVRDCFLDAGIPADLVHVVPLGVDCAHFSPSARPVSLPSAKRWKFLFIGGTIHRKGIDILLAAWARAFSDRDDVCLVIKDMGTRSFYRGQTAERSIAEAQQRAGTAQILYLDQSMSDAELAGLYTACDCLVHPYRGEGFGLPIAEGMASGLPVIVTGMGAALDFCDNDNAYLIPARRVQLPEKRVGDLETVDHPWLAEADVEALAAILRHVRDHPDEARAKSRLGRERILAGFT
jgi:glycosyltransferase involved in cell wall biosynthesis/SAM-dependent methyltransferase